MKNVGASTIPAAQLNQSESAELIRDTMNPAIQPAAGQTYVVITPDDAGDKVTVGITTGAFLSAMNIMQVIPYSSAVSSPARTLLPGYTLPNVIFDSQAYPGAVPPAAPIVGDLWDEVTP